MGKSAGKWRENISMDIVMNAINTTPIKDLMPIAKIVCGSDHAVYHYNDKNHSVFYKNDEAIRKALRRCVTIGAFDHRKTIICMLD